MVEGEKIGTSQLTITKFI